MIPEYQDWDSDNPHERGNAAGEIIIGVLAAIAAVAVIVLSLAAIIPPIN